MHRLRPFLKSFPKYNLYAFSDLNKKPNLYKLLQLQQNAGQDEIRYNYFKLMSKYKIDNFSSSQEALNHSKLLNEAYAILSNQKLKAKYDTEQGYGKSSNQTQKREGKKTINRNQEVNVSHNQAKRNFTGLIGDKQTRFQQKLLVIVVICVFILSLLLIFDGKRYREQIRRQHNNNQQAQSK